MEIQKEVDLYFELSNCPKMDWFSQSDPFLVVYLKVEGGEDKGKWIKIGNTETCSNNHNPRWVTSVRTNFFFEQVQTLRFDVFDEDTEDQKNLSDHDFVGSCSVNLGQLCHQFSSKKRFPLVKNGRTLTVSGKPTTLLVRVEEVLENLDELELTISGHGLAAMDWWGTSDPYVEFLKPLEDGSWLPVAKTETIKLTVNPKFKRMTIKIAHLCNGNYSLPIKVRCLDWNLTCDPMLIGEAEVSVRGILGGNSMDVTLKNPEKQGTVGTLRLLDAKITSRYSFLQFLDAGLEIQLVIAIDFSKSNGDPSSSTSLHALNKPEGNEYQQAIRQVVQVLEPYDTDGKIPVYGFGCKKKGSQNTSQCMPLTFKDGDPEVDGLAGVMEAYASALQDLELTEPTLFEDIMEMACTIADGNGQTYTILLLLTHGMISDMDKTINSIIRGCKLPLSIIIVGVGSADFGSMEILNALDKPLKNTEGEIMQRNIVQFVPFNKFKNDDRILAAETLRKIPGQVTDYMKMVGMSPKEMSQFSVFTEEASFENKSETFLHTPSEDNYICPITLDFMKDPVIAADGCTYERVNIEEWLKSKSKSPMTNLELPNKNLIPNNTLKSMIMERAEALAKRNS